MTQLSAALARIFIQSDHDDLKVKASSAIYEGSGLGVTSGYVRQLVAGDKFAGFARQDVASQTNDGDARVRTKTKGKAVLTITSVAVTDIGKPVFASDGNTFTLTQSTNSHVGRVIDVYGTNLAVVEYDAHRAGLGAGGIAELTDSTGGTASDTVAAIGSTYSQSEVRNMGASIIAKVNAILRQLG